MAAKPDQINDFLTGPRGGHVSLNRKVWPGNLAEGSRPPTPQAESGLCCAYNQTCERFLSADVEAGDFTSQSLDLRLQTLSPSGGNALWLVPFRGISPTSVRMPIDLLYLDPECVVIEAIESFPIFRISATSRPASSVLVLPPQSIASTGTRSGHQLIFRPPSEMKLVLEQLSKMKADSPQRRAFAPTSVPGQNPTTAPGPRQVLPWRDTSRPEAAPFVPSLPLTAESPVVPVDVAPAPAPQPAQPTPAQTAPELRPKKKGWLQRLLSTEPEDKRGALREPIPGLTAFFFTGGAPVPHGIRDVSETGIYVFTEERWYPGTVIRLTLTDQREPTAERSFTVNAAVMRWGNDGVGLHFIFQDKKDRRSANRSAEERTMGIADAASFKEFLSNLRRPK